MKELWKEIEDTKGMFLISTLGRVKGVRRKYLIEPKNKSSYFRELPDRFLKNRKMSNGYLYVTLRPCLKNRMIHRLVAKAFIDNPQKKSQVNHINGIKSDNRVENLEWATQSENNKHAFKMGLQKPNKKFTQNQAEEIRDFYQKTKKSYSEISRLYGVSLETIRKIILRKSYI